MKKPILLPLLFISLLGLSGCDLFSGDSDNIHKTSFEAITGKFVLHDWADSRYEYHDTYFDIDGSKDNFSLKYYENGQLKREGKFNRVVTRKEKIGKIQDNLHFNVQVGNVYEHISTYSESLDPINQFRIIEEYYNSDQRYYLSELPYVMGTYVREGKEYKKESKTTESKDYTVPTSEHFTSALNGFYKLDDDHYFYFVYPIINDGYAKSYFQYYSSSLEKPLEGFAYGKYSSVQGQAEITFSYSRQVLIYTSKPDHEITMYFGYFEETNVHLVEHWGSVDFSDGVLNSFTFEHLSRPWTDAEMDKWTKDESYHLPDPIIYDYVGGTYIKQ